MRSLGTSIAATLVVLALFVVGCGASPASRASGARASDTIATTYDMEDTGGSYDFRSSVADDQVSPTAASGDAMYARVETASSGGMGDVDGGESMPPDVAASTSPTRERFAQAQTSRTPPPPTATDAVDTSGELLIYTALFHVGVYDVEASQASIAESARSVGGFVFQQADDRIVVRVPGPRFRAFLDTIEGSGDVLHRQIDAQDVGEEFRDVEIRIRNLEQVRDRIADLLTRGLSVEQVLVVERELERVTSELERMRGRQRYLADRIAYSTITVVFQPAPRQAIDQPEVFRLPFAWLDGLGLPNLLELR